ncbi:MAG: TolC family protein [Phycisphaerales bacterium]|nr:MAG: TolC family protein [Phycisphaerales bacterium]
MNCDSVTKKLTFLIITGLVGLGLSGCARRNYKADADEKVYNIIDYKWRDDFGTKANYKISDTVPSPNDIVIEKEVTSFGVLTLPQAVALATAHNREYQTQKEALYIKALDLDLIRHNFERLYYGRLKGTYAKAKGVDYVGAGSGLGPRFSPRRADQDLPVDPQGALDGDEFGVSNGFGFDQLLTDGTRIGTNVALSWGRILNGAFKGESLISLLSFEITKPLLRGSDRRVVLESLTQAERDVLYQVRSFNRFRKTFVVMVVGQYYRVLELYDVVRNAEDNHKSLTALSEHVEKLASVGRVPLLEVGRLRQEILRAREVCLQATKEYEQALDEFKITLGLPTTAEFQLDESVLNDLKAAGIPPPDFSENEAIETALLHRLDLANTTDAIFDSQRKVLVAADGLRTQLDLSVNTNIVLQGLSSSDAKALQDLFLSGLLVDLPFDRDLEQNIYRKTLIALNQRLRESDQAADMVTLEVRQAYRDLTEAAERHRVQSEGLKLAEKRFENTFMLMKYGRASSRRVLQARDDLFDAQKAATDALVDFTIATLEFYRDTGTLRVRPDGMWQLGAS